MDEYANQQIAEKLRIILVLLQEKHGLLKLFSSRSGRISRSVDEISKSTSHFLKNQLEMYNIKIFLEDETKRIFPPICATYYNYLLLNTNFSSQYLLRRDIKFGHIVHIWPTLSPYLFIQIIWCLKCEDLLIESLTYIPLDLCVEILETTIKCIDELATSRAKRIIILLIYKIYDKCLWLHLGTLSEQNVTKRIRQLTMYFEMLLDLLLRPKFVTSHNLFIRNFYGIFVKNTLYCIKKCMRSKIKNYLEDHNLSEFFTLTYGNFNEHINYHHMLPPNEVKSIIIRLDQKLTTLLLNQIEHINSSEYVAWENIVDDKNTMISLHRGVIIECHYLREFIKQNNFLIKNQLLRCLLRHLIGPKQSEEYILSLQELCHHIANGYPHGMKELIKRYKEWDLSTLDFIRQRIRLLDINDLYIVLEYLLYKFTRLHIKAEKYQVYVSVLKILIQLNVTEMHYITLKYMERHFDDNCLECLYDEQSFDKFIRNESEFNNPQSMNIAQKSHIFLIFILLNPKEVLSKLIFYEMSSEFLNRMFQYNIFGHIIQSFFRMRKDEYNILMYILKNKVLQPHTTWNINFRIFIDNALNREMMTADDVINELYIPYLINHCFEINIQRIILLHIEGLADDNIFTDKLNFIKLIVVLIKKLSLLRRSNATFSKFAIYERVELIYNILNHFRNIFLQKQHNIVYFVIHHVEPLDMRQVQSISTLNMIQEYEKRCFIVYQRLCTNPRCHPTLRSYVQSFTLDREAFIRHMMLHSFENEYLTIVCELTFIFRYDFGWIDHMMAYENIIRITADVWQIALTYLNTFPKHTFIMLLYAIVKFCKMIIVNVNSDNHEAVRRILLRTLFSLNDIVSETFYGQMYDLWLKRIQKIDPGLKLAYFDEILKWIDSIFDYKFKTKPLVKENCICDEKFYCKYHGFLIKNKIATKYNAYMFVRECIEKQNNTVTQYSERLMRNLLKE